MSALFSKPLAVLNAGLASFADAIEGRGGAATRLEWAPPAAGDRNTGAALARLVNHPAIEKANATAAERYLAAQPRLVGVGVAREALPGMNERRLLHAGPPVDVGAHVRPDARRDRRRHALRRLGRQRRAGRTHGRGRRRRLRPLPPPRRGRPDVRDHQPVDAGLDGAERDARQPRLQQPERRAGQGTALRRQQHRGARAAEMDGAHAGAGCARRPRGAGRCRDQAADGAGAAHGRRGAQPQRRRLLAAAQAPGAGAAEVRRARPMPRR